MHIEIITAAIVEVANRRDSYVVAIDERPRHHRNFRAPLAMVRWYNEDPPRQQGKKNQEEEGAHVPLTGEPERPERKRGKSARQSETQGRRWQVRIIDGQDRPSDEENLANQPDSSDQPCQRSGKGAAMQVLSHFNVPGVNVLGVGHLARVQENRPNVPG